MESVLVLWYYGEKSLASLFSRKPVKKVLFLASGRGSNLEACLVAIQKGKIPALPIGLICDKPGARCLEVAKRFQVPTFLLDFHSFPSKMEFHNQLLEKAINLGPDLIVTAGYMRLLQKDFVEKFRYKIINIHPSLLPAFPGIHSHRDALAYGVKYSGCTVHFVDEGVDTGPIILQEVVKVEDDMREEDLAKAVLQKEHKILPLAIRYFCENKLIIQGRKVRIKK